MAPLSQLAGTRASAPGREVSPEEPLGVNGVQLNMKLISYLVVVLAFGLSGCASAPAPVKPPVEAWPSSVAQTCPERRVSLCCFRSGAIREAMGRLTEDLQACHGPAVEPVLVELTVETLGGVPSCVERSLKDNEAARCLATAVARGLVISDSPREEACSFRYPVRLR